ncbi:unnamed protein product [Somion occarium]
MVPVDKTGTSARILLHDTQANLEKFTGRLESLTKGLEESKRQICATSELFERGHEHVTEEMVSIVNRCQAELQKSLGTPAQKASLDEVQKNVSSLSRRFDSLSKQVEILHLLNQTQSQSLQMLQEQQGQLLASVVPLLPLLQALPLHLDVSRTNVKESLETLFKDALPKIMKECLHDTLKSTALPLVQPATKDSLDQMERRCRETEKAFTDLRLLMTSNHPALLTSLGAPRSASISSTSRSLSRTGRHSRKRRRLNVDDEDEGQYPMTPRRSSPQIRRTTMLDSGLSSARVEQDEHPSSRPALYQDTADPLSTISSSSPNDKNLDHAAASPRPDIESPTSPAPEPTSLPLSRTPSCEMPPANQLALIPQVPNYNLSILPDASDASQQHSSPRFDYSPTSSLAVSSSFSSSTPTQSTIQPTSDPDAKSLPSVGAISGTPKSPVSEESAVSSAAVTQVERTASTTDSTITFHPNTTHFDRSRSVPAVPAVAPNSLDSNGSSDHTAGLSRSHQSNATNFGLSSPLRSSKPVSLKDRRAHGLWNEHNSRSEKRFIPLDDDDEEDEEDEALFGLFGSG